MADLLSVVPLNPEVDPDCLRLAEQLVAEIKAGRTRQLLIQVQIAQTNATALEQHERLQDARAGRAAAGLAADFSGEA